MHEEGRRLEDEVEVDGGVWCVCGRCVVEFGRRDG
jgi:hypothetical protein